MRNILSTRKVEAAKPKEKAYRLADGGNLYLCVYPSGTKSWQFRYTRPGTKRSTYLSFGTFPDVKHSDARKKAAGARKMLREWKDPQHELAEKKRQFSNEQARTLQAVAEKWKAFKQGQIKDITLKGNWRKLERYVLPGLGKMPISKITAPVAIEYLKQHEKKEGFETLKRAIQLLKEIMNFAVNNGWLYANPLINIDKVFKNPKSGHFAALSPEELPELMQTIQNLDHEVITHSLILIQLHTMTRPFEASGAEWNEIDFENASWTIPWWRMKSKKDHTVPLTTITLDIFAKLKSISGNGKFVFPSDRIPFSPVCRDTVNNALKRLGLNGKTTAHGFRALASTTLNNITDEKGSLIFESRVIEAALSHIDKNRIHLAYNRQTFFEARKALHAWWSEHIENALRK